jgi:U3 small nucleolar RNA-associated protein 20
MVSSNSKQIRGLCSSIFVQFLLDYPLQNERVEQHLNFVLKNLSYEQAENRL